MIREEQIIAEAKKHYYDDINCHNAFLHGVEWADEYPANVWHQAIEIPTKEALILYRTSLGRYDVIFQSGNKEGIWKVFVKDYGVAEWAYVNELRPKGGE